MQLTARAAVMCLLVLAAIAASGEKPVVFMPISPSESGIQWTHTNGRSPQRHLPETVGSGAAFLDFDQDGRIDIFFVNSGPSDFFRPEQALRNALYRNNGDGTFTDVTGKSGLSGGRFYGMGVAVGDFDNDGWPDLYITGYGGSALYHNNRDGTFSDVTVPSNTAVRGWSTSAVWFDYDNDGRLDLFVARYVRYDRTLNKLCNDALNRSRYCVPRLFQPETPVLFHNDGNGKFTDVSTTSGIAAHPGKALGVVATDFDNDGRMDLFVANDMTPNSLFMNEGRGHFRENGLFAGVAYSEAGTARSGMGADAADIDGDGYQDLFVDNIDHQSHALYRNLKDRSFEEDRGAIARATYLMSGWGCRFFDVDNDGDPDLIVANGHPDDLVQESMAAVSYAQPLLLFENLGGLFRNISLQSGSVFQRKFAGRGLAIGDIDNDGDLDVLVTVNGGAPLLLRNDGGNRKNWLGLRLIGTRSNRDGIGAVLTWEAGGKSTRRLKNGGGSYLSSSDPREILGLDSAKTVSRLEIRWPSGLVDTWTNLGANRYLEVHEGETIRDGRSRRNADPQAMVAAPAVHD